jgi:hypothetical protein
MISIKLTADAGPAAASPGDKYTKSANPLAYCQVKQPRWEGEVAIRDPLALPLPGR